MANPSQALTSLKKTLSELPADTVITAGRLVEMVAMAEKDCEDSEYYDYMGEDM